MAPVINGADLITFLIQQHNFVFKRQNGTSHVIILQAPIYLSLHTPFKTKMADRLVGDAADIRSNETIAV